ncbi:MAG: hypothetical protein GXO84_09815 [Chlorobi bacterium]|nr:hypothetical protein [Chlorobiota bacterium]
MRYENIDEFADRVERKRRTIFRFYKDNPELKLETKKKGVKRIIPITHEKYWKSDLLFEENKKLIDDNIMMENLLNYLYQNDKPLANHFWGFDWSYFIGINYKDDRSKDYCITKMNKCYEMLQGKYGHETTIRLLFSTEVFSGRDFGEHNHVVLYVKNKTLRKVVLNKMKAFFKNDRFYSDEYCRYKGGIHYMLKEGVQGEDWDILGNNLKAEGIKYENKGYKKAV